LKFTQYLLGTSAARRASAFGPPPPHRACCSRMAALRRGGTSRQTPTTPSESAASDQTNLLSSRQTPRRSKQTPERNRCACDSLSETCERMQRSQVSNLNQGSSNGRGCQRLSHRLPDIEGLHPTASDHDVGLSTSGVRRRPRRRRSICGSSASTWVSSPMITPRRSPRRHRTTAALFW
jgi:hypothetical protein